ncbi:class I SAM-dependent methyltransferase [Dictyobacter formicarum]|uniref:Class I SAM-dependent methyltransferase n=1 Tax=Dictyobacter formicarum TaxID=2778368 RepID=A0ABQ3VJL1_9CHLR|nr:class I SAM-dependent methyltransferase [Dictyobacter formicarum]GHO85869.1 class I SAM-dependent methyltransferase [Dictyobacter formicarum]
MTEVTNSDVINAYAKYPQDLIESFGDEGDLTRQHLLNPAIFSLLGDVRGKTILDAGCGQGYLCRLLARAGASVTGVEPSEAFHTYALHREQTEQLGIHYVQADLSTWTPPQTFDFVIANMVLMDIPDYEPALKNCVAALGNQGGFIFSLLHPCFEEAGSQWQEKGYVEVRDYFRERAVKQTYGYFIHRPLSTYLNSVIEAGCTLQRIIEPQLEKTIAELHHAERYWSVPGYIIIFATKFCGIE